MSSLRHAAPGKVHCMIGMFFLFSAALLFYVVSQTNAKWHRLHEHGTRLPAVVSEKHVIRSEATRGSTSRTYHRVFFLPGSGLQAAEAELWSRTSVAKNYPDSVSLFAEWGNRLWSDFSSEEFDSVSVGQEFEMLVDGEESLRFVPGGAPGGWMPCIVLGLIGSVLVALGVRRRRAFLRAELQEEERQHAADANAARGLMLWLACGLAGVSLPAQEPSQDLPPHIVFVLADDLGWTDLSTGRTNGGNGSPYYKTPTLDALAAAGTCFTNAYSNGPNCAPTRAALWSGQWGARTGIYTVNGGNRGRAKNRKLDAAANKTTLEPSVVTLAETLHAAGYTTAHFGKWHLGGQKDGRSPTDQGFDHQAGGDHRGGVGRVRNFADKDGAFAFPGLPANGKARQFMADRLTDEALQWMANADKPLFCCLSHYSVHTPIEAPAADIKATPKADPGWRHTNRRYAAMMKNLDDNCGRVMKFLAETDDPVRPGQKLLANTLIVFTSDNGGLGGYREAGIAGGAEVTNQLPLRSGKGSLFEGGTRVPFIVRWDGKVKPGAVDATPLQSFDLYPTFATIAKAGLAKQQALDGVDLSGRWRAQPTPVASRPLYWHFPGYLQANDKKGTWRTTPGTSMRRGNLKVVFWYETRTWSLFDLATDLNEANDLSATRPEELRAMASELRAWLVRTKAPMPRVVGGAAVALPDVP